MKRKLKNCGRPKAFLGIGETGAILTAAAMNVAATQAAAIMQSNAAKSAARSQADATINAARTNADALKMQNENSNNLQTRSQEFVRAQNEQNRDLQKDVQMNLQMLTGYQSNRDRKQATKLQLKNGGKPKTQPSLRGSNIGFKVTDGGGVNLIGTTPEGYELYEIKGNDHEHYHKAQGGKNKTGVGIKFQDGNVVEGEGNQNSNLGELLMTTPEGGYFISKHSLAGFNPAKAVLGGMHPVEAFNTQENIKQLNGITDDGRVNSSPVEKKRRLRLAGGLINSIVPTAYNQQPDFSTDTIAPTATGVVYAVQNPMIDERINSKAKCGKRVLRKCGGRKKAWDGMAALQGLIPKGSNVIPNPVSQYTPSPISNPTINNLPNTTPTSPTTTGNGNSWWNNNAQYIGAGVTGLGNIAGALITNWGNNRAANILSDAYNKAGQITADAYRQMHGIDMSSINREDYAAQHYMPAVRSYYYNANPELTTINRTASARRRAIGRNTLSSAAMLSRLGKVDAEAADLRNKVYADKYNREEQVKQSNLQAINEAAAKNAELDTQANQQYASAYLNLLQYNNDIENQKLAGIAEAQSNGLINSAGARASSRQANASAWSNALAQSALGFGNTISAMAKQRYDRENVMLGASNDAYYRDLMMRGTKAEKEAAKTQLKSLIARSDGETRKQYQIWYNML